MGFLSAAWTFFKSDWKNAAMGIGGVLGVLCLLFGIGYFVVDYNKQTRLAVEHKTEADKWKANYEQAAQVNKKNQTELEGLRKDASKFAGILKDREQKIDAINQEVLDKEAEVERLRRENEQIRTDLEYVISCGLWRQIFPSSALCPDPNKGGQATGSGKPSATVR